VVSGHIGHIAPLGPDAVPSGFVKRPVPAAKVTALGLVGDQQADLRVGFHSKSLGPRGADTYRCIVGFIKPRAAAVVDDSAWYSSIVGVAPSAQGRGIGARLVENTLAEADDAGGECFLETFDSRNPRFYRTLGFCEVATHVEPVTGKNYTIMSRQPKLRGCPV
jgi:ribosomal protein S18 acetylase RimI-like enzyme